MSTIKSDESEYLSLSILSHLDFMDEYSRDEQFIDEETLFASLDDTIKKQKNREEGGPSVDDQKNEETPSNPIRNKSKIGGKKPPQLVTTPAIKKTPHRKEFDHLRIAQIWIKKYVSHAKRERYATIQEISQRSIFHEYEKRQNIWEKITQTIKVHNTRNDDTEPTSFCQFSPDSKLLASASSSGICKVWSVPDFKLVRTLSGHSGDVCCIAFHPKAPIAEEILGEKRKQTCVMASSAGDGSVNLWGGGLGNEPLARIQGHEPEGVSRLAFHPSGRFLGTCCHGGSWRIWDIKSQRKLHHEVCHSKAANCISFQNDGALLATGGDDSGAYICDIRTNELCMSMKEHERPILAIDFAPNGNHIATASEDNSCKIWDFRTENCLYTLAADTNSISDVKYQRDDGHFFVTASLDGNINIWSGETWQLIRNLTEHEGKISSVDVSRDNNFIATSSYDSPIKIWELGDLTF